MITLRALARRLLPRRLGKRLQWSVALGLCLAIALFGAWTIHEQTVQAMASLETQAMAVARNLAMSCTAPLLNDKLDQIDELTYQSANLPQVLDIRIIDDRGHVLSHVARTPGQQPRTLFDAAQTTETLPAGSGMQLQRDEGNDRLLAWHPVMAGSVIGWVRLAYSTEALGTMRQRIWVNTLVASLIAGLVSAGVMALLVRRPLQAIGQARDFAVGLARSDGQQIEVGDESEETVALGLALNQASTRLLEQRLAVDAGMANLRRKEAALADTNEQLSTIFALSPDGLVSFDSSGMITFANQAFCRITGVAEELILNRPAEVLDAHLRMHAAEPSQYPGLEHFFRTDADGAAEALDNAQDDDASPTPPSRPRMTLSRPRLQVLEIVGRQGHSDTVSRLLYVRDVTHESEVDRMKSEFLAAAAHELRTPMTSIHACIELLQSERVKPERREQLLGMAARQSATMISIVNELLNLSRIEARGGEDFNYELVDLYELVRQAIGDFVPPAGRAEPDLIGLDCAVQVRVDRGKFLQVARNLLSNAYKYSTEGQVQVRLLSGTGARDRQVGFQVQDQGIGMTPEQSARVFERFYRADTSGHVPGTGLGMSIVQKIVHLMGGSIDFNSQLGVGTTVSIWLPSANAHTDESATA